MRRRLFGALICCALVFAFAATAEASTRVIVDGKALSFQTPPVTENGRTLVPLRAIFEALNAKVYWDERNQTIGATKGDTVIKLIIGGKAYKNDKPVSLDVPAKIVNGSTLVPLRFVSEALGAKVDYKNDTIKITSAENLGPTQTSANITAAILGGQTRNLNFGHYSWRVLSVQYNRALLLTEDIIEQRPYNTKAADVTWENCSLRQYLNGDFYSQFTLPEQAMILTVNNSNQNNQWFKTSAGNTTTDKVFLLSIGDVVQYLGDSGQLSNEQPKTEYVDDTFNSARVANYKGQSTGWWLRSPGRNSYYIARVNGDGRLNLGGEYINTITGGVRPAIWLNLK